MRHLAVIIAAVLLAGCTYKGAGKIFEWALMARGVSRHPRRSQSMWLCCRS